eukprot:Nk52_evm1s2215 gene=Nk52_evmTU1s2215
MSKHEYLLCDLQGNATHFFDPAFNSHLQCLGKTDMGTEGICKFFLSHKCNDICMALGLNGMEKEQVLAHEQEVKNRWPKRYAETHDLEG